MNKVVEIYSLKRLCRAIVGTHPPGYIEFHSVNLADGSWLTPAACGPETRVQIEKSEVHMIRTDAGDRYIAMEPGLRGILEAPFEARVSQVESWSRWRVTQAEGRQHIANKLRTDLLAMPWWKRALFVLRRRNLERQ